MHDDTQTNHLRTRRTPPGPRKGFKNVGSFAPPNRFQSFPWPAGPARPQTAPNESSQTAFKYPDTMYICQNRITQHSCPGSVPPSVKLHTVAGIHTGCRRTDSKLGILKQTAEPAALRLSGGRAFPSPLRPGNPGTSSTPTHDRQQLCVCAIDGPRHQRHRRPSMRPGTTDSQPFLRSGAQTE